MAGGSTEQTTRILLGIGGLLVLLNLWLTLSTGHDDAGLPRSVLARAGTLNDEPAPRGGPRGTRAASKNATKPAKPAPAAPQHSPYLTYEHC
jgi:hypothetical protein